MSLRVTEVAVLYSGIGGHQNNTFDQVYQFLVLIWQNQSGFAGREILLIVPQALCKVTKVG